MIRVLLLLAPLLLNISPIFPGVSHPFGTVPYKHYSSKQGLASSNVLGFYQDKKGYIWFATTSGLSRFDGTDFNNFTTENGLLSNNLTGIDSNGSDSLFIATYDKGVNVLYHGKISNYAITNNKTPLIHHLISKDNHLFIYADYLKTIFQNKIKDLIVNIYEGDKRVSRGFQITNAVKTMKGDLLFASSEGIIRIANSGKLYRDSITDSNFITSICQDNNGTLWFGGYGEIWKKSGLHYRQAFKDISISKDYSIQNILVDRNNDIWFSQANGNLYLIKNNKLIDLGASLELQNTQINFINEDREGNIWIGTYGKGIYCFFNLSLTNYSTKDNLTNDYILSIDQDPLGRILVGTYSGLNVLDNDKFVEIPTGFAGDYHYIRDIQRAKNDIMYVTGTFEVKYNHVDQKIVFTKYQNVQYRILSAATCFAINDSKLIIGGWDSDIKIKSIAPEGYTTILVIKIFTDVNKIIRANMIAKDKSGNFWVATTVGLCEIKNKKPFYFKNNPILNTNVNDVKISTNGDVWVAGDLGVSHYFNNKWVNFTRTETYDLTSSNYITFDKAGNTWIGNSKGLFKIKNDSVLFYTDMLGLRSNEINVVYYDSLKNNLWVGTVEGLAKINLGLFYKMKVITPNVCIEEVRTSDSTYNVNENNILPDFDQRKITIRFSAINFRNPQNLVYEYRNGDENAPWEISEQPEIQFASLYPGNNTIYIRAKCLNGNWSKPAVLNLYIKTPFLSSYWFYGLVMLALLVPAFFLSRKMIERNQEKELEKRDIEKRIIELKQQAMSAMMNPHFIFNSLNSIQNFINNHGKKEANLYLTSFAKLIRLNLDITQNSFINLDEELERLELYLKLEKMRFGDNFSYSIKIDESVDPSEIIIPNMIIQPFVENGIWHGILPNDQKGNLTVWIGFTDKQELLIQVEDDGIGYFNSLQNKKSDHISKGISIIKERLNLLNNSVSGAELVRISNLNKGNSDSRGTLVQIILPDNLYSFETDR